MKSSIQEKIVLQTVWTVEEASNLALKAELMEKTPRVFSGNRRFVPNFNAANNKDKDVVNKASSVENKGSGSSSSGTQQNKAPVKKPDNPYAKPSSDKCFRCGGQGHRSNFDTDVMYKGRDNVMLFKWGNHKIAMAPVLDFNDSAGQKKSNFLVISNDGMS
ncbi:hypothetical protein POM88_049941 [Heracleum sosnowskyi]|uniref:CCHC-type domain-containing protein n=1 Tax=Heracleum sosnowskyi TaxID=360622 RepID=A0AAD8LZX9_9APIA|nr:hypothetical protein POM88_049941 [Heracleum sosnowskyi]